MEVLGVSESSYEADGTLVSGGLDLIKYRKSGGFVGEDTLMTLDKEGFFTITRSMSGKKLLDKSGKIDVSNVIKLVELLEEKDFFSFEQSYHPEQKVFDGFVYSLEFIKGDQAKTVMFETEASPPESFDEILKEIEKILKIAME